MSAGSAPKTTTFSKRSLSVWLMKPAARHVQAVHGLIVGHDGHHAAFDLLARGGECPCETRAGAYRLAPSAG